MPIALKLSKRFYETIGQEVANQFVDALNAVDTSYRAEFRDLFAAHFGQLRAGMDALRAELRAEMNAQIGALRAELLVAMAAQKAELYDRITQGERRLLVWMIGLWLAALPTMAGLVFALRQLGWL